jgi:hypothetical protein
MPRTAEQIFDSVEKLLTTAKFGLTDLQGRPERRKSGLMNAIVFGRNATFALQNLRSVTPDFDAWYKTKQEEMKADPLMKAFNETRRKIEHEAHVPGHGIAKVHHFDTGMMRSLGPAPPGATGRHRVFYRGRERRVWMGDRVT